MRHFQFFIALLLSSLLLPSAWAQGEEAFIRKTLKERMPH